MVIVVSLSEYHLERADNAPWAVLVAGFLSIVEREEGYVDVYSPPLVRPGAQNSLCWDLYRLDETPGDMKLCAGVDDVPRLVSHGLAGRVEG